VKLGFSAIALAALLSSSLSWTALAQQQQSPVPDAPTPQAPLPLSDVSGPITPGLGAADVPAAPTSSSNSPAEQPAAPSVPAIINQIKDTVQATPPVQPAAGEGVGFTIRVPVNFVEVPVTVKDSKGKLVAGLTFRDFKIFENDTREPISFFTIDSFPLSIAFILDQSLTSDVMAKVNNSLGAIQGALTPYDEVAVFSYNNGAQERTGFTGAQSNRLPAVLALTKETGRDMQVPVNSGPMAGCNVRQNGNCVDPNLQPGKSAGGGNWMTIPKEIHTFQRAPRVVAASSTSSVTARSTAARPNTPKCCVTCKPTRPLYTERWWVTRRAGARVT
jgi:hypothetical protein